MRAILILALGAASLTGQESLVERGYSHFYNLEYPEALVDFQQAAALNPADPELRNHVAQTILVQEMYRDGALESELVSGTNSFVRRPNLNPTPEMEKQFLDELGSAMTLAEGRLQKSPRDTAAMYALGISYGLRSNYYWVVKKAWRDCLRDANSARHWHNRITDLEPDNLDARLVQGLHDYIVGSLPWTYRVLGFMVGIHGDKARGIQTVQEVSKNGKLNRVDAEIFLSALYRRENQTLRAIPLVQDLIHRFPRNYLLRLELSQMYSMAGDKTNALQAIGQVAELKRRHAPGYDRLPWEKVYYHEGSIQFWYNDLDRSLENLRKVAAARESVDLNTEVYAWLRIGQIYDLFHRRNEAIAAYKEAIVYAPQADAAQESRKYLSTPYKR